MKLQEIKEAVDAGKTVRWINSRYKVIKSKNGGYMIGCDVGSFGESYIGLTHRDGITMNGEEKDFFVDE